MKEVINMTTTNYEEQATKLFNELDESTLNSLIVDLNEAFNEDEPIFQLDEWIELMKENQDSTIVMFQIMQQAGNNIDLTSEYIQGDDYFYNYHTADSIIDLFDSKDDIIYLIQQGMETLEDSPVDLDDDTIKILKQAIK